MSVAKKLGEIFAMIELLTLQEKKDIVKNAHRDFERQLLQAQIEVVINEARTTADGKPVDVSAFKQRVSDITKGIEALDFNFADYLK